MPTLMDTKHTPGPWHVCPSETQSLTVEQAIEWPATDDPRARTPIMICTVSRLIPSQAKPRDIANARLIAAAPELLEALKAIQAWSESRDGSSEADEIALRYINEIGEAAIAKATGQQ